MQIKEIVDYYEEGQEADVIVTDGVYDIMCYAQPFFGKKDTSFSLLAFGVGDIVIATEEEYLIRKLDDGYYSYFIRGKLIDVRKGQIQLGKIIIEDIKYIPKDILNGEFIEFNVIRFDLVEK